MAKETMALECKGAVEMTPEMAKMKAKGYAVKMTFTNGKSIWLTQEEYDTLQDPTNEETPVYKKLYARLARIGKEKFIA